MADGHEQGMQPDDPGWLLSRRIDGDLTPEEAQRLDALLNANAAAQSEMQDYEQLDKLLAAWSRAQPEFDWNRFHGDVMARIRRPESRILRGPWSGVVRIAAPLAAAAAIILAVWLPLRVLRQGPRSQVLVQFQRPAPVAAPESPAASAVRVAFARETTVVIEEPAAVRRMIIGPVARTDEPAMDMPVESMGTY